MTQAEQFEKEMTGYMNSFRKDILRLKKLEPESAERAELLRQFQLKKSLLSAMSQNLDDYIKRITYHDNNSI